MATQKIRYDKVYHGPYVKPHPEFYAVEILEYPDTERPYPNLALKPFKGKDETERWNK